MDMKKCTPGLNHFSTFIPHVTDAPTCALLFSIKYLVNSSSSSRLIMTARPPPLTPLRTSPLILRPLVKLSPLLPRTAGLPWLPRCGGGGRSCDWASCGASLDFMSRMAVALIISWCVLGEPRIWDDIISCVGQLLLMLFRCFFRARSASSMYSARSTLSILCAAEVLAKQEWLGAPPPPTKDRRAVLSGINLALPGATSWAIMDRDSNSSRCCSSRCISIKRRSL
mmetsp:Transcript_19986/g.42885  ORF Transcript_19986/g.42885 Transcript_19986/m.42885 type:complete len:226 (+) Transcript_19986:93-770(+)